MQGTQRAAGPGQRLDDDKLYSACSGVGSCSTLCATRAEGEEPPPQNPMGFIWPERAE